MTFVQIRQLMKSFATELTCVVEGRVFFLPNKTTRWGWDNLKYTYTPNIFCIFSAYYEAMLSYSNSMDTTNI